MYMANSNNKTRMDTFELPATKHFHMLSTAWRRRLFSASVFAGSGNSTLYLFSGRGEEARGGGDTVKNEPERIQNSDQGGRVGERGCDLNVELLR